MYPYFLFAAFLQGPSLPAQIPLFDDCSGTGRVVATLRVTDPVRVRSSLAGESQTCYAVNARVDGQDVSGYVLGKALPAIVEFERERIEALRPKPAPVAATVAAAEPAPRLRRFPEFSGLDLVKNRTFTSSTLNGKLILVCFWSPSKPESEREVLVVSRIAGNFAGQGVQAVGISLDRQAAEIKDTLEDANAKFPNIADENGLADREGISFESLPYTYILNQRHEILASGLHGSNLESTVQKLMKEQ